MPMQREDMQRRYNGLLHHFRSDTLIHGFVSGVSSNPGGPFFVSCIPTC